MKKSPSPPKNAVLLTPTNGTSYVTLGCSATRQPVSIRRLSPAFRSTRWTVSQACRNDTITLEPLHDESLASEESDPDFFWNAMPMETAFPAQRNASF